jgi:Peptidase inhibitor family I36
MHPRKAVLLAVFAVLTSASAAMAQRWGREHSPRDGVCFYRDTNFHGDYFCVASGGELSRVPEDMNDKITSIRIFGRAEVIVFKDIRFVGGSSRFDFDVRNLKDEGWNDRISSMRVQFPGGYGNRGGSSGYGGNRSQDPDRIIRRAYQDLLEREPDQSGLRLYRSRMIDEGWTETQVRESIRDSQEYREKSTMTYAKAQEIVRRAYQSVLRREPDPGSRGYVDKVMRDHWTQQDVERELRKSAEYRNKGR